MKKISCAVLVFLFFLLSELLNLPMPFCKVEQHYFIANGKKRT